MTAARPAWRRLYSVRPLTAVVVIAFWFAVWAAWDGKWLAFVLALAATVVTLVTMRRGQVLADRQRRSLRAALAAADARNRELDRLQHIARTLLSGETLAGLQQEVARAAAELVDAEAGAVMVVVEEGRFLKIVAATGALSDARGDLISVEGTFAGLVVLSEEPLTVDDPERDPRLRAPFPAPFRLANAAVVPLRSSGIVIGALAVYNRRGDRVFEEQDLRLLATLAEIVVLGLDRQAGLEAGKLNEAALAQKNRELIRATRLKSEFLANMSHELRTPLNAIIGFSDLLLSGSVGDLSLTQRDFLEPVLRNGRHLLGLINSVLDLSKIEAGHMTLSLERTDLREAIEGAVADTASLRAARGQTCEARLNGEGSLVATADRVRVRQILFNLLSNASKFTGDAGTITVTAVRTRAPLPVPADRAGDEPGLAPRTAIWVSVVDSGIGIRPEDLPRLFQQFSQLESAFDRGQQGTGLGLALCKRFVEMHGGTIGVDSIPGRGSAFWFFLPVDGPIRGARGVARSPESGARTE